jgi:hypothetical protein
MTRLARMVVSGLPHHVTQRGNRREPIFFEDGDQEIYRDLLGEQTRKADVEVWAYCLMPNHVHLILNPRIENSGLGRTRSPLRPGVPWAKPGKCRNSRKRLSAPESVPLRPRALAPAISSGLSPGSLARTG